MSKPRKERQQSRPFFEWAFGVGSALVVACVIAFLVYQALQDDGRPPDLSVRIERIEHMQNGHLVIVRIENSGDQAAAEVGVEAVITSEGADPATKQIGFDYVPANSVRRGAFIFEGEALTGEDVRLTVHGFVEP